MGILPGVFWVTTASHHWPYGHNLPEANVPAVSCIICFAMPRIPDGCDLEAKIWQQFDLQVPIIVLQFTHVISLSNIYQLYSGTVFFHRNNSVAK